MGALGQRVSEAVINITKDSGVGCKKNSCISVNNHTRGVRLLLRLYVVSRPVVSDRCTKEMYRCSPLYTFVYLYGVKEKFHLFFVESCFYVQIRVPC